MKPLKTVAFVEPLAIDRLTETEVVLLSKFEHASNRLPPARRIRRHGSLRGTKSLLLNDAPKIVLQIHTFRPSPRKEGRFDL